MQRIRYQAASASIGTDRDESTNAASLLLWLVLHGRRRKRAKWWSDTWLRIIVAIGERRAAD